MEIQLWNHQKAFVDKARQLSDVAGFMEPGTGKTGAQIEALRQDYNYHKCLRSTLIFTKLSVCKQWKEEFARFAPKIPQEHIHVLTGVGKQRTKILQAKRHKPIIVITNYEATRITGFYEELLKWCPEITVLDESQTIKDSGSQTAKKIYPLTSAARRRFILTGSPILNSLLDVFGQVRALSPGIFGPSFWKFRQLYFYDKNAGMPAHLHFPDWQAKPDASRMIGEILGRISVQAKKVDCLDLPPLLTVLVKVQLGAEQRKLYDRMTQECVAELRGVTSAAEWAMTKTLRLQQILQGFVQNEAEGKAEWVEENPRLKALSETLESIGGRKTIIWTTFRPSYRKIEAVCHNLGLSTARLTGEQNAEEKQQAIEDFNRGSTQVLISNPAAGGIGISLQSAPYAIYFSRSYSLEHFIQSQARNWRGGSEIHEKITHFHLIAEETLDEIIYAALKNKQNIGETILAFAKEQARLLGMAGVTGPNGLRANADGRTKTSASP